MPELPEVETIRRTLEPVLVGQEITGLNVGEFAGVLGSRSAEVAGTILAGRRIAAVRRRGKFLLIDLDDGSGIEVHLRMTGTVQLTPTGTEPLRFQHLAIHLANDMDLRFADQRKFGRVIVHPGDPLLGISTRLGPEPLSDEFTSKYLAGILRKRTAAIKSLLLDQRIVAGLGNIYADEALFLARIHPARAGRSLSPAETQLLRDAIREALAAGIEHRGTTFSSYRDGTGKTGEHQHRLRVYGRGRGGLPCLACGQPLAFLVIGGRTSHFCPHCQPAT